MISLSFRRRDYISVIYFVQARLIVFTGRDAYVRGVLEERSTASVLIIDDLKNNRSNLDTDDEEGTCIDID